MNQGATAPTQGVFSSAWVRVLYSAEVAYTMVPDKGLYEDVLSALVSNSFSVPTMTTTMSMANAVNAGVLCEIVTVGDARYRCCRVVAT